MIVPVTLAVTPEIRQAVTVWMDRIETDVIPLGGAYDWQTEAPCGVGYCLAVHHPLFAALTTFDRVGTRHMISLIGSLHVGAPSEDDPTWPAVATFHQHHAGYAYNLWGYCNALPRRNSPRCAEDWITWLAGHLGHIVQSLSYEGWTRDEAKLDAPMVTRRFEAGYALHSAFRAARHLLPERPVPATLAAHIAATGRPSHWLNFTSLREEMSLDTDLQRAYGWEGKIL